MSPFLLLISYNHPLLQISCMRMMLGVMVTMHPQ
jgi:hypothetical protein